MTQTQTQTTHRQAQRNAHASSSTASASPSASASTSASSSSTSASTSAHPAAGSPRFIDDGHIELISVIGTGAYGVVYLALDGRYRQRDGRPTPCAVKCLRRYGLDERQRHFQRREIALHRLASGHPSIITMNRLLEEGDWVYMVMQYGDEGDLFAMVTDKQRYVGYNELVRSVFLQLIDGVRHLHHLGIAHRDIKPENIVCSEDGTRVRICDFGLATSEVTSNEFGCGSTFYIAPECLGDWFPSRQAYSTQKGDVWSLGVILVNLVCGRNPWRIASPSDESFNSFVNDPTFLRRILPISEQCLYVLCRIFAIEPTERISIDELRELVMQVEAFTMDEEELLAAHYAAKRQQQQQQQLYQQRQLQLQRKQQREYRAKLLAKQRRIAVDPIIATEEDQWPQSDAAEYEADLDDGEESQIDMDEGVFAFDDDLDLDLGSADGHTPSLRADTESPTPRPRSSSVSSNGGSLPPTPLLGCTANVTVHAAPSAKAVAAAVGAAAGQLHLWDYQSGNVTVKSGGKAQLEPGFINIRTRT